MNDNEITPEVSPDVAGGSTDDGVAETTSKRPKRLKMSIAAAVIAAVVAGSAGVGIPLAAQAADHNAAVSSFTSASDELASALTEHVEAGNDLVARIAKAKTQYESYAPFATSTADDLLTDGDGSNAALAAALAAFAKSAGLSIDESGAVTVAAPADEVVPVVPAIAEDTAEIKDQTKDVVAGVKTVDSLTDTISKKVSAIDAADAAVLDAITKLEASASAKGATLTFTDADPATVDAAKAAAAALVADGASDKPVADRLAALNAYTAAVKAARDSAAAAAAAKAQADAQAGAQDGSYSDADSDYYGDGGQNTGGGGGQYTGGGGGGGGQNTGGGGSQYTSANRGRVLQTGSGCGAGFGPGGSGSANWASNVVIPAAAASYSVWEDPDNNVWGVDYRCQNEDW